MYIILYVYLYIGAVPFLTKKYFKVGFYQNSTTLFLYYKLFICYKNMTCG